MVNFKPLSPLTGEDEEWFDASEHYDATVEQNKRNPSVFRNNKDNSTAYDIDGMIFSDNGGETWFFGTGSKKKITFPYSPPDEPEKVQIINNEI